MARYISKAQIISSIREAFKGVPCPEKLTLHVAKARDDYDYDHDDIHRSKDHRGTWETIPEEQLLDCHNAINYLDTDGLKYYLPALMLWVIENYKTRNGWIFDETMWALGLNYIQGINYTLGTNDKLSYLHDDDGRFSLFTYEQIMACVDFLNFLIQDDPQGLDFCDKDNIKEALEFRWLPYLKILKKK